METLAEEIWKTIPNTFYEASSLGRIRSTGKGCGMRLGVERRYNRKPRILSLGHSSNGFLTADVNGGSVHAHVLVARAFIGPKPKGDNKYVVKHKDWNKHNNKPENLEYVTWKQLNQKRKETWRVELGSDDWTILYNPIIKRYQLSKTGKAEVIRMSEEEFRGLQALIST